MLIDSHQHVFWHDRDDAGLIADMDEQGVDKAWLLTWEIPAWDQMAGGYHRVLNPLNVRPDYSHGGILLGDLLRTRDKYPDRFEVGYCPDPLNPHAAQLLESAYHMHGVRICAEWKFQVLFEDPRCLNVYRKAGELGMPVVLHLDVPYLAPSEEGAEPRYCHNWYGGTVDNLERALIACPNTNFIGHAPGFWRYISGDAEQCSDAYPGGPVAPGGRLYELFDTYPNLYADLSAGSGLGALKRDPAHAVSFMTRYADRLLWGRDIYGDALPNFLATIDLPVDVRAKVESGNALRLLGGDQ